MGKCVPITENAVSGETVVSLLQKRKFYCPGLFYFLMVHVGRVSGKWGIGIEKYGVSHGFSACAVRYPRLNYQNVMNIRN